MGGDNGNDGFAVSVHQTVYTFPENTAVSPVEKIWYLAGPNMLPAHFLKVPRNEEEGDASVYPERGRQWCARGGPRGSFPP